MASSTQATQRSVTQDGTAIRAHRMARKWSGQQLAAAAGTSIVHVSRLENGKSRVSVDLLERLAAAFGIPEEDLLLKPIDDTTRRYLELKRKAVVA